MSYDDPTHFAPHPTHSNMFRMFRIDHCDECGCEVEAPNAMSVHNPEPELVEMGFQKRDNTLPEIGWCEATGNATCEDCWKPED